MKTPVASQRTETGSVLLICLLTAAILGITLASYLTLTMTQHVSVMRSQTWNASMAVAEAGVEDALAMINQNAGDFELLSTWTNSISANHWTDLGAGVYYVRRYLDWGNWGNNYYDVYVTNVANAPCINVIGTVMWNYSYASAPLPGFAAVGVGGASPLAAISRRLRVRTKMDPLFSVAMAAIYQIDLSGNNVATDSFDSGDPLYCNDGLYPYGQLSKQKDAGDVVTDHTIINSLDVGNANIKGQVKTGPGGTISIGPNGSVGDKAWVEGNKKGI